MQSNDATHVGEVHLQAGEGSFYWHGRDDDGRFCAGGSYFIRVWRGDETYLGQIVLIR